MTGGVLAHDRSRMVLRGVAVEGDVAASGSSRIRLEQTRMTGAIHEFESARLESE